MFPRQSWCIMLLLAASTAGADAGSSSPSGAVAVPSVKLQESRLRVPAPPRSSQELHLLDIHAAGEAQVAAVVRSIASLPPGAERDVLMRRISEIKRETRISILRARVEFARQRGDFAAAREIEIALLELTRPRQTPVGGATPQIKPALQKGGRP
jgi:hypothetical protein